VVKYHVKEIGGLKECITEEILPRHLGAYDYAALMRDYNILFHPVTKEITSVVNRTYGEVVYKALRLDASSGFVMGSTMKLWTVK
jgi:hypothetical protein